eukprot:GHRR01005353.1.p1 GENE.GHRR01005353.1~~GHRR01005353.1.p1  ORF type:complete len:173 (-),score=46.83 GHRR01005353.1:2906-3424(-)
MASMQTECVMAVILSRPLLTVLQSASLDAMLCNIALLPPICHVLQIVLGMPCFSCSRLTGVHAGIAVPYSQLSWQLRVMVHTHGLLLCMHVYCCACCNNCPLLHLLVQADEVFTSGTAVVVSSVGSLTYRGNRRSFVAEGAAGSTALELYNALTQLQTEQVEDPFGWMYKVC